GSRPTMANGAAHAHVSIRFIACDACSFNRAIVASRRGETSGDTPLSIQGICQCNDVSRAATRLCKDFETKPRSVTRIAEVWIRPGCATLRITTEPCRIGIISLPNAMVPASCYGSRQRTNAMALTSALRLLASASVLALATAAQAGTAYVT